MHPQPENRKIQPLPADPDHTFNQVDYWAGTVWTHVPHDSDPNLNSWVRKHSYCRNDSEDCGDYHSDGEVNWYDHTVFGEYEMHCEAICVRESDFFSGYYGTAEQFAANPVICQDLGANNCHYHRKEKFVWHNLYTSSTLESCYDDQEACQS